MSKLQINLEQSQILHALRTLMNCSNRELICNVYELAIDANLKMKPIIEKWSEDKNGLSMAVCRNCGKRLYRTWNCCPVCARKLDWS